MQKMLCQGVVFTQAVEFARVNARILAGSCQLCSRQADSLARLETPFSMWEAIGRDE